MIKSDEVKVLKDLLSKKDITQLELANELGVSRKTINNWLSGKSKMRLSCNNIKTIYKLIYQEEEKKA